MKNDPETKKLFAYLVQMQSALGRTFFEERQQAEQMFDQAVANIWLRQNF